MSTTPHQTVGIPKHETFRQGLFYLAIGLTVTMLAMLTLGLLIFFGNHELATMHATIGYFAVLLGIAATVAAWRFAKVTHRKGVFFHALSLPILMVVQIGLGEMAQTHIHMGLGIALLVAVIGLVMMTRKPVATI